jgi:hypothetical protein
MFHLTTLRSDTHCDVYSADRDARKQSDVGRHAHTANAIPYPTVPIACQRVTSMSWHSE